MSKVRVGVVGLGGNGSGHTKSYWHSPNAELVGICDLNPQRLQWAKDSIGLDDRVGLYTSLEEMLGQANLDALSVNTSDHLHAGPFVHGLQAGCHVIVEKPMGNTLDDLYAMTEAARQSDRKTMVGQILRFNPYYNAVHDLCASGKLGEIFYLESDYIHALQGQADPARVNPYIGNINWYLEHEKVLVGGCSHQFDLLRWFADSYAVEVMGYGNSIAFPAMKHPDCMCAVVKLASGAVCKLTGAYGIVGPRPAFNNLEVYGTQGTAILLEPFEPAQAISLSLDQDRAGFAKGNQVIPVQPQSRQSLYELELEAFLATVSGERPPDRSLEHELLVQETLLRGVGILPPE